MDTPVMQSREIEESARAPPLPWGLREEDRQGDDTQST